MNVETTIVVEFGSSGDEYLSYVRIDPILNTEVDDDGTTSEKTSFSPTDVVYLSAHFSDNVILNSVVSTDGSVSVQDDVSRTEYETELFASRDINAPDVFTTEVITTEETISYIGRVGEVSREVQPLGNVSLTGNTTFTPFLAEIGYSFTTTIYKLDPPPGLELEDDESYTVHVVFYITVI